MISKNTVSHIILYGSLLVFIAFVVYILYINQEVFYTAYDRSEFIFGAPFFHALLSKPFGLMRYAGAWLTQFFCQPAIGTGVLMAIWALIFLVGTKAFRLQGSASAVMLLPVACLLVSVVDLGYWIYVSTIRGYWFSQSVAYLLMLLLLWAARCTPRKWHLAWYLIGFCIYPVLVWFALLFMLCLALTEKLAWPEYLGFVLLLFTAAIWHTQFYSNLRFDDVVLAGMPRFELPMDSSERLSIPFWILGIVSMLIPVCYRYLAKWFVPALCAIAGIVYTATQMYYDKNYIDEMRMVRYAEDDNWQEVLQIAEENKQPTSTMVFIKNVAHYGMMNEAIRLNFENAIQAGFSPFYLKMLCRCALAVGDEKLVERYTTILHHQPFYGDWQPAPVTDKIKELEKCYPDELTGVENSESYLVNGISLWYESDSKVASEQALLYAMLRCDSRRFWLAMRNYVKLHLDEECPLHAQEAYILFIDKAPEEKRMMLPVKQSVFERYKKFWSTLETLAKPGKTIEKVGEEMREEFGDTYWWYNIFGRKFINITGNIGHEVQS